MTLSVMLTELTLSDEHGHDLKVFQDTEDLSLMYIKMGMTKFQITRKEAKEVCEAITRIATATIEDAQGLVSFDGVNLDEYV